MASQPGFSFGEHERRGRQRQRCNAAGHRYLERYWDGRGAARRGLQENNAGRTAGGRVAIQKFEMFSIVVDPKRGDGIATLVAGIQVIAAGIDIDVARIVAAGPCFAGQPRASRRIEGKNGDGVVKPVGRVKVAALAVTISEEV